MHFYDAFPLLFGWISAVKNISNKLTVLGKLFFTLSFLDVLWYDISVFERMVARWRY